MNINGHFSITHNAINSTLYFILILEHLYYVPLESMRSENTITENNLH